jgi:hypothetical protein
MLEHTHKFIVTELHWLLNPPFSKYFALIKLRYSIVSYPGRYYSLGSTCTQPYSLVLLSNIARREQRALLSGLRLVESKIIQAERLHKMLLEILICILSPLGTVSSSQILLFLMLYGWTVSSSQILLFLMLYGCILTVIYVFFCFMHVIIIIYQGSWRFVAVFHWPKIFMFRHFGKFYNFFFLLVCRLLKFSTFHKMICWQKTWWYLIHTLRYLFG